MKKNILILLSILFLVPTSKADEGMWIPMLLGGKTYANMKAKGLKLSQEQIYSINKASLKDAIVRLGRGFCTGEVISSKGLILTNHHCGYGAIQSLSSVENNYLKNGFWAKNHSEELPAGFSMAFLMQMKEVTTDVLVGIDANTNETERAKIISKNKRALISTLTKEAKFDDDKHYSIEVKSYFSGNYYYALYYQTFPDVRLVGVANENIGKFGGDTDNWMWTRHTGDFSMFRIYSNKDNKPAAYSKDNVPYKPKHHLPVNIKGVKQGDYSMIWGYPGGTDRYLTSYGVKYATSTDQPSRVKIRRKKLDIYEKWQAKDPATRLKYASKHARVSNYWKYFIGQTASLKALKVYEKKQLLENRFEQWIKDNNKTEYKDVMATYKKSFEEKQKIGSYSTYLNEAYLGIESLLLTFRTSRYLDLYAIDTKDMKPEIIERIEKAKAKGKIGAEATVAKHFKDFDANIDKEVCAAMLSYIYNDLDHKFVPKSIIKMGDKCKGDWSKAADYIFKKSSYVNKDRMIELLNNPSKKKIMKDPLYKLRMELVEILSKGELSDREGVLNNDLDKSERLFTKGLMEMQTEKDFYPNANSTMRVTYGSVEPYSPKDATYYDYFTTQRGLLEKYKPGDLEFDMPPHLIDLLKKKDFGQYANKDGDLPVCFLSTNDITGGNSGSPVINGDGHLIGLAFDGNWEAMSGDIVFNPKLQRTINVDIRYVLFIVDKYAGAKNIIAELDLRK